jgi:bifunctional UDP-N-acetylglucosamine pyrophosphorylase / glucosamine-1-phosphate N-acetyltransferase
MNKIEVVILAAGRGTRMNSTRPKVLHELAGKSLIQHVVDAAIAVQADRIHVVIGHEAELIRGALAQQALNLVLQLQQLGTGHAVHQALPHITSESITLVLCGDVPLIQPATLETLLASADTDSMAVLTCTVANPAGLGRIVREESGAIRAIVEEKDATEEQRLITEINTGIMALPTQRLQQWLPRLGNNNAQGEYYLTDIIALALTDGCRVLTTCCQDEKEVAGINDRVQLAELERHFQRREATALMKAGVTLRDPARFDIRGTLKTGRDVEIDVNVLMEGEVSLGDNVSIGPNCVLKNCVIGSNTVIAANCVIEDARIGSACAIGPFARIRPGTVLEEAARIGNFVELKNASIGRHSKVNHLSYVGDSELGDDVNIGAGTITCNYDGANKHRTLIGDGVFVGSNTALVAPLIIAEGATVGAGSVITRNVEKNQLAVARGSQVNRDDWQRPRKKS